MTVILNYLYGWKFVLINPAHEFPRATLFIGYFLDFEIEEGPLCIFDSLLESFPVFNTFQRPIFFQISVIIFIPLVLWVLCDINDSWVLYPGIVYNVSKIINNLFQFGYIWYVRYVQVLEWCDYFFNKQFFLFTIFGDSSFTKIDVFFSNRDGNW